MLKKPCVRSLEFSFSQLLFPFTDFYESFDFFSLFCETGAVSYVFFNIFARNWHGRQELIPSRMTDVRPISLSRTLPTWELHIQSNLKTISR